MSAAGDLPSRCFQGVIPSLIATSAQDGTPNVAYLSQVVRLDDSRVALSCQFFNKTKQNVLENPFACVELYDPLTFEGYRLELRYDHSEESGPLFDAMAMRIQAIASHTGMSGVFRLISADIYEVLSCEKREELLEPAPEQGGADEEEPLTRGQMQGPQTELKALQLISQRTCRAVDLESLLSTVLETLEDAFGFRHSMALLPDETGAKLFMIASRGYDDESVGAEVTVGEGLIGTVARERRLLRVSDVDAELRYGRAIRATTQQTRARQGLRPEIPLAGLHDAQSHMAMPLVVGDRLVGVLAVESRQRLGFDDWDEAFLEIVSNQVAVAIENVLLRGATEDDGPESEVPPSVVPPDAVVRRFRFFRNDDCVFIDDEYLIRNVPGRILWKILRAHVDTGRTEFSNRELRLDAWLGLPALRDNLESRLVLLRKRLEQRCPEVRLVSTSRGHFRLEAGCTIVLEETNG